MDDLFDHETVPEYNTRAVEKRTGVPADTFRAWERRHGLPAPFRTPGNHRLYSERDIAIIVWLKQMTDRGVSISHAVSMAQRRLEEVEQSPLAEQASAPGAHTSDFVRLTDSLITAFSQFDAQRANQYMEEALALFGVETVCLDVIQPTLIELGAMWERGEICVAVEHFGTSFCMRKLSALFNASQPEFGEPTVVMSCVEGEMHEIGLMFSALILSRSGYRVIYLGSNLPGCELHEAIKSVQPDAVVLAATTSTVVRSLGETVRTLRASGSSRSPFVIAYGGAVFEQEPDLRDTVDAVYLGKDARGACKVLHEALQPQTEGMVITAQ